MSYQNLRYRATGRASVGIPIAAMVGGSFLSLRSVWHSNFGSPCPLTLP
jgi:hypothetical protein